MAPDGPLSSPRALVSLAAAFGTQGAIGRDLVGNANTPGLPTCQREAGAAFHLLPGARTVPDCSLLLAPRGPATCQKRAATDLRTAHDLLRRMRMRIDHEQPIPISLRGATRAAISGSPHSASNRRMLR
jgi:hypothetical protein